MTKPAKRALNPNRLRELLAYCPETGLFTWRQVRGGKSPGDLAGSVCHAQGKSYIRIRLDDELIMAHRLVWLYVYGVWPDDELDHEDGDGTNNRLLNLIPADRLQNNKNASLRKDSKTGIPGVNAMPNGKFQVTIRHRGVANYLGTAETLDAAARMRKVAQEKFNFHPTHGKKKK